MSSFTQELTLGASAPRLWLALKDSPVLFPKIAPQVFSSIEHVEGSDDKVGAVRLMKFGSAAPEGAYVKEKLTALDHDNLSVTTEELEGGHLAQGFTKWSPTVKFTPIDDKSCKLTTTVAYEGGSEAIITQAKEGFAKLFTGLTAYINSTGAYA